MFKSLIKITSLLLITGLTWTGISAVSSTMAYFNDTEGYENNELIVGILDFSLSSASDFSPQVTPTQGATRYIDVINEGSLGFEYTVYASDFSGDTDLCSALDLVANLDGGVAEYAGDLTAFSYNAGEFIDPENWEFTVTLPSDASADLENETCSFKFIFEAEQVGDCYGFIDVEEIVNNVSTGSWAPKEKLKINKVYYDVDCKHGSEPANEWVELYNPSADPINIANWTIEDNNSSDVLAISSLVIPAYGYAVITGNSSTWGYWIIPSGAKKIVLADGTIGDGLANNADMLVLRNASGIIVDQMNWGIPDVSWPNYNDNLWNPGVQSLSHLTTGYMLSRSPNGYDTDSVSDFIHLYVPRFTSISYPGSTWYCGHTYSITWTANNFNGHNSDLKIDIFYIVDMDGTGTITSGDTTYHVADHIDNSGHYNFYIDPCKDYCHIKYVWIKLVAYGPENFMVQNSITGPRVYEPMPPENELEMMGSTCPFAELNLGLGTDPIVEPPAGGGAVETVTSGQDGVDNCDNPPCDNDYELDELLEENTAMDVPVIVDIPDIDVINTTTSAEDGIDPPDDDNENE